MAASNVIIVPITGGMNFAGPGKTNRPSIDPITVIANQITQAQRNAQINTITFQDKVTIFIDFVSKEKGNGSRTLLTKKKSKVPQTPPTKEKSKRILRAKKERGFPAPLPERKEANV